MGRVMAQWRHERPDLDVSPQGVIGRVHRVAAALTVELVETYGRFGLGEGEFDVLATLRRQGSPYELTPSELATQTMVSSGAITKRVDRCIGSGWAERRGSSRDARSRLVRLTPSGLELIDRAFAAHIENEHRLLSSMSDVDREALAGVLSRWASELGV